MGLSTSAGMVIVFIALFSSGIAIYTGLLNNYEIVREAGKERELRLENKVFTDIDILEAEYDRGAKQLKISIENEGDTVLDVSKIDVIIDGLIKTGDIAARTVRIDGATTWNTPSFWPPNSLLNLTINNVNGFPLRVEIVTGNGIFAHTADIKTV